MAIPCWCWPLPESQNKNPVSLLSVPYAFLFPGQNKTKEGIHSWPTLLFPLFCPIASHDLLDQKAQWNAKSVPTLTPFPAYHGFINFDSTPSQYISHFVNLQKFGISWPMGARGPQFKSLIRSSTSLKKLCLPCFSLLLMQADGEQIPQPHLLNMNEPCHNTTTRSSDKLSTVLRKASELYGHFVKMHLSQMHIWPFLFCLSQVPSELSPLWAEKPLPGLIGSQSFFTFTSTLCTVPLTALRALAFKIPLLQFFLFQKWWFSHTTLRLGSTSIQIPDSEVHLNLSLSIPLCLFSNQPKTSCRTIYSPGMGKSCLDFATAPDINSYKNRKGTLGCPQVCLHEFFKKEEDALCLTCHYPKRITYNVIQLNILSKIAKV